MAVTSVAEAAKPILDGVYKLKNASGQDASYIFQVLPDKKLTDYYRVIKRPMALNIIRQNLRNKKYKTIAQFVRDVAQITHNARTYNPPESFIYTDAVVVDNFLREQLQKLRQRAAFPPTELEYPDLGPLPVYPQTVPEDDSMDSMDDSDQSGDEPDEYGRRRRRRPVRRSVLLGRRKRQEEEEEEEKNITDPRKRRGRPPTVDKPHEQRIKAVVRAVRRERDPTTGRSLYLEFEKLPDAKLFPDYYEQITEPVALDAIRKNIKRRNYSSFEVFLKDINTLFNNAKQYNAEESQIYQDAQHLQRVAAAVAEEELKKPDAAYQDPDSNSKVSRVPLDHFEHRGETYGVGDWVHISNPNDPAKPTVGQIFRIWQENGQKWINACWYYRPEQTVHRHDKLFYENEVVKSGQYRDHPVDEILEKCFVMFITKYQRGRPADIGNRSVYCCESRYNDHEKTFNKIRTWKACIPDEVRSSDYPMTSFKKTKQLRRVISPIKHLLPSDAKDTDPVPDPKMGAPNAPPIVGAVYKRPVDPNDPPELPTPSSPQAEGRRASPAAPSSHVGTPTPRPLAGYGQNGTSLGTPGVPANPGTTAAYPPISGTPGAPASAVSTAYALPQPVVSKLDAGDLHQVAKLKDGQVLWFPACPIWVSHRVLSDPVPKTATFTFENETEPSLVAPRGFGHSAKYMAWKLAKQSSS